MAFGDEVRFKIGGDTSSLSRSFSKAEGIAEASGRKMERSVQRAFARMRAPGEQGQDTRRRLADDAALERRQVAQVNLGQFKKKQTYEEATTVGKIKIVTGELADLAKRRAKEEEGSVSALRIELAIEERMAKLRGLRQQQQVAQTAGGPTLAQQTKAAEPTGGGIISPQNIFRAVGGVVAFALERMIAWQQSRIQVARSQEAANQVGVDSLRGRFAAIGGLQGQLTQGKGRESDLEHDKQFYESRKTELTTGVQGVLSHLNPQVLTEVETKLQDINGELQKQHDLNAVTDRELNRELELYSNQKILIESIGNAKRKGIATEQEILRLEGIALRGNVETEYAHGTPEAQRAAELALATNVQARAAARITALAHRDEIYQTLAQEAAKPRRFQNGQLRAASETERIAQRASAYRQRAAELVVTNGQGNFSSQTIDSPGFFINAAKHSEALVADRLGQGSSSVSKTATTNAADLKPELVKANQILTSINQSLSDTDVGVSVGK